MQRKTDFVVVAKLLVLNESLWKDKIHKNTPYKSQFLDFLVINSHVKSNHHDEHHLRVKI
jgi:hypothetical protein